MTAFSAKAETKCPPPRRLTCEELKARVADRCPPEVLPEATPCPDCACASCCPPIVPPKAQMVPYPVYTPLYTEPITPNGALMFDALGAYLDGPMVGAGVSWKFPGGIKLGGMPLYHWGHGGQTSFDPCPEGGNRLLNGGHHECNASPYMVGTPREDNWGVGVTLSIPLTNR